MSKPIYVTDTPAMTLEQAIARMDAASLSVLREADAAHRRGENVGVYRDVLREYGALLPLVREAA